MMALPGTLVADADITTGITRNAGSPLVVNAVPDLLTDILARSAGARNYSVTTGPH